MPMGQNSGRDAGDTKNARGILRYAQDDKGWQGKKSRSLTAVRLRRDRVGDDIREDAEARS